MSAIGRPPRPVEERFAERVRPTDRGCHEWLGYLDKDGYGSFSLGGQQGRTVRAHRWAYERARGEIPDGLVIDHLCRNRACVNPDHMEAVLPAVNTLRGHAPTAINARKVACKRGHPLSGSNLVLIKDGRACRTCRLEATRRWRSRQKESS